MTMVSDLYDDELIYEMSRVGFVKDVCERWDVFD